MCVCVCVCARVAVGSSSLSADPSLFIFTHMTHRWFLDFPLHLLACLTPDAIRAGGQDQSADISIHLSIYLLIEDINTQVGKICEPIYCGDYGAVRFGHVSTHDFVRAGTEIRITCHK